MHPNRLVCRLIAIVISSLSLIQAVHANNLSSAVRNDDRVRFKYNSTSAFHMPNFHANYQTDEVEVFYCNPGQPISPDEAYPAITSAITEVLSYLAEHTKGSIPGGAFQESSFFRPKVDI